MTWNKAYVWGWVAILVILASYELYAVFTSKHSFDPPLTWVTVRYCPWWITMPFLTWLFVHFAVRYMHKTAYITEILAGK